MNLAIDYITRDQKENCSSVGMRRVTFTHNFVFVHSFIIIYCIEDHSSTLLYKC